MGRNIIVMGASAGGVQALAEVVASLPADLPASVFTVLHLSPYGGSTLPDILSRRSVLPAIIRRTERASSRDGSTWRLPTSTSPWRTAKSG